MVTNSLRLGLHFFSCILQEWQPRVMYPLSRAKSAVVLYTDAEWSEYRGCPPRVSDAASVWPYCAGFSTGMGGLCFCDGSAVAASGEAPAAVIDSLKPRMTQITPLELLAVAAAVCTFAEQCQGRDVLLFCDNQAACAAIAKGASRATDLQLFTTALHALCFHWHIALWVEYVPTGANPADELSRVGSSPYVKAPTRLMMPAWSVTSSCEPVSALRSDAVFPFVPTRELRLDVSVAGPVEEPPQAAIPGGCPLTSCGSQSPPDGLARARSLA
jgi:hypothetical protein